MPSLTSAQSVAVTFIQTLMTSLREMFPGVLLFSLVPLIPFIIAEQIWPVDKAPRFRDYGMNVLIGISTTYLSLPVGIAAGLWGAQLRHVLPWQPFSLTFHSIASVPTVGPALELLAMICVPLFLHDLWFYWSHRLEHRIPVLWAFGQGRTVFKHFPDGAIDVLSLSHPGPITVAQPYPGDATGASHSSRRGSRVSQQELRRRLADL